MEQRPPDEQARNAEPEDDEDWAAEITRLRAARGERLAARLAEEPDKEPPVG